MIARITSGSLRSRGFVLLPLGALALHQLRYVLAYGNRADAQLAEQGHSYLDSFAPWLVLLLCLAAGRALAQAADRRRSAATVWVGASAALLAIYAAQELLEGLFAAGHPGGLTGVFGDGGWWAVPLAVAIGGLIALLLRAVDALAVSVAAACETRRPLLPLAHGRGRRVAPALRPSPLAGAHAGRAPPFSLAS